MTPLEHIRAAAELFDAGGVAYFVTVTKSKRKNYQSSLGKAARRKGYKFRIADYHTRAGNVIIIKPRKVVQ